MKNILLLKICFLGFFAFAVPVVYGTTATTWTQSTEPDFCKGSVQGVSIHSTGEIHLASKINTITGINNTYVWSMAIDNKGWLFVGAGDPGVVYCVKNNSHAVKIFQSPELYIQSLAVDGYGNIYAGTAPRGIIYKINPDGNYTKFCDLPVSYIWDMKIDSQSNLFAATGIDGILYKISPEGVPFILFDSSETNLMDLLIGKNNSVYVCSEPNGIIYKIERSGDAKVLFDAEESEIHCMAKDSHGNIYAGTASGAQLKMPRTSPETPKTRTGAIASVIEGEEKSWNLNASDELTMTKAFYDQQKKTTSRKSRSQQKITGGPTMPNCVYKIDEKGGAQKIFELQQSFIFDIKFDSENNLFVVAGNEPGIYKIFSNGTFCRIGNVNRDTVQLLCCQTSGNNELYIGTGNSGMVLNILPEFMESGIFTSNILDTTTVSNWGCIYWPCTEPEGTKVQVITRSGNFEKPDSTWSEWSKPYKKPWEKITSPPSRFIQYKVILKTTKTKTTPKLSTVAISYLPENQAPVINNFELEEQSLISQKSPNPSKNGKPEKKPQTAITQKPHYEIAQKKIKWNIEDPNNDTIKVTVLYKGIDEEMWKKIDENMQKKGVCTWNTLRLPDGEYQIKLIANDTPDNPPEISLETEVILPQHFFIDNSRPVIKDMQITPGSDGNEKYEIIGTVLDKYSKIVKVQYTIDGQEWISAYPADGVFDSPRESFKIITRPLEAGNYTFIINAFDSEGNIGTGKITAGNLSQGS